MPDEQKELFLLDANIIIHAHDYYYHMERVPEFWRWLEFHAGNGSICIPLEIIDEIKGGTKAQHANWAKSRDIRELIVLREEFDVDLLNRVLDGGYGPDLDEIELEKVGKDPFLIAYGLRDPVNRTVVSNEIPKPSARRKNRKVPDVCADMGVRCCNVYELLHSLDFRTNWRDSV